MKLADEDEEDEAGNSNLVKLKRKSDSKSPAENPAQQIWISFFERVFYGKFDPAQSEKSHMLLPPQSSAKIEPIFSASPPL